MPPVSTIINMCLPVYLVAVSGANCLLSFCCPRPPNSAPVKCAVVARGRLRAHVARHSTIPRIGRPSGLGPQRLPEFVPTAVPALGTAAACAKGGRSAGISANPAHTRTLAARATPAPYSVPAAVTAVCSRQAFMRPLLHRAHCRRRCGFATAMVAASAGLAGKLDSRAMASEAKVCAATAQ